MRIAALFLALACLPALAQNVVIAGRVTFPDGSAVANARIAFIGGASRVETQSDDSGNFTSPPLAPGSYGVQVSQEGAPLAERTLEVTQAVVPPLQIVVSVPGLRESMTVSATLGPRPAAAVPSSVTVLDGERIRDAPEVTLDQMLRTVPGFSLFRRTSSLAAHPTAQGVSLRGIGPSGASRSLVLVDGFPVNDPFGGWVYWDRVPKEAIASVEVLRGAASSLYGNEALSGVLAIYTERPQEPTVRASIEGGGLGIVNASWMAATRFGRGLWGAELDGESFRDDGYFQIGEANRGSVDRRATLAYTAARARVDRRIGGDGLVFASAGILTERRGNGTIFQNNSTDLRYGSAGVQWRTGAGDTFHAGVMAQGESFRSGFSSVSADRHRETPTLWQRVPVNSVGAHGDWSRTVARHTLVAGGDFRWVQGDSIEHSLLGARSTTTSGGREKMGGLFIQDVFSPAPRWQIVASARADRWQSTQRVTGAATAATVFDPQLGIRCQLTGSVALRAQGYRGFRGPTLNELYRRFQVGNIVTLANPSLVPERTNGGEAGADITIRKSLLRLTGFWTDLRNPVSNVSITATLRRRQNVGADRIRGLEADWEWQPAPAIQFRASYLFDDAVVRRFDPDPTLEGHRIPEVPRHQGAVSLAVSLRGRGSLRVNTQLQGVQFDDDRSLLRLAGYGATGASFTQPVGAHFDAFVHAENLFDRRYPVALTPFENLSQPRIVLIGVRFHSAR